MKSAAEPRLPRELLDQFETYGSPWGRRRLQWYLAWKRVSWRWLVGGAHLTKRGLDIVGSLFALIALSPLLLVVALLIKLEDRGPVFFRQIRVGRHGREFGMW